MKDSEIRIRTDKEFLEKVDYLQLINGYKNRSDTIRRTVEKEYGKETMMLPCVRCEHHAVVVEDGRLLNKCLREEGRCFLFAQELNLSEGRKK